MERIQKVIAASGIASRRKAETMILEGRVKVNGEVLKELGYKVKKGDFIEVDGKSIQRENKVYYVMNKPKKSMCTS
ncbi:RNA-binding S4 domain-containing protein, partial [Breznakia sp. OttesenSCG-928-G09]|nr:RNA-binding S4 domain-containing protein [Breznakia sp. OttesenSCG-928-G09]